jgi:outer membrane protein, multidrug efflux system
MRKAVILLFVVVALGGCMVGPDYKRPTLDLPNSWRFEDAAAKDTANEAWWGQFDDPVLKDLIQVALQENKDVRIAAARVEQFLGLYGTTRAALYPQVGAGASASRERTSQITGPTPLQNFSNVSPTFSNYEVFLNASWELDLWGKLRRATEAARANLLSSEDARRAVLLTLVASVANSYVNLRDLDKQLEISKQTVDVRAESYRLFQLRFQGGVISELELNQVKSEYEEALSRVPFYEKLIAQQENALSVLLGRNPGPVPRGKSIDELVLPMIPAGLPSDLLANRPDIRQAEESLVAANANIGVAKAQYFPTISLTGLLGFASNDLSKLFTSAGGTWALGIPAAVPIFTAGAIAGQVKAAEAVQQQLLFRYQQTIQTAFREVDDALVDQKRSREQLEALGQQVGTLRQYARIARLRFDEGYTSYLEVLDAERSLFNAQLSYAQTQGTIFQALVNIYKAMGGGWVVEADKMTGLVSEAKEKQSERGKAQLK